LALANIGAGSAFGLCADLLQNLAPARIGQGLCNQAYLSL